MSWDGSPYRELEIDRGSMEINQVLWWREVDGV